MPCPLITVVLCTYNRAEMLRQAVRSLAALQTEGRFAFEIVVIDNASTDHTPRVIAECAAASPVPIRGVCETRMGVSCARNRGVAEAHGEWIAFFDDDQLADSRWLIELLAMAQEKQVRCVGGAVRLRLPDGVSRDLAPNCRAMLGESVGLDAPRRYDRRVNPGAGNLMLHESVFAQVGGFDETLTSGGEDTDLFRRIRTAGIEAWYTPAATVQHIIPAERLETASLRWTSLRIGGHVARRERAELGTALFPLAVAGRAATTLGVSFPRWLLAKLRGDAEQTLGAACRLWLMAGYFRQAVSLLAPRLGSQGEFASQMQFRLRQTAE